MNIVDYGSSIYFVVISSAGTLLHQYLSTLTVCAFASAIFTIFFKLIKTYILKYNKSICIQGSSVFLSYQWTSNYISVYSTSSFSFTGYFQISISSTNFNSFVSDGSKIYFGGDSTVVKFFIK